MGQGIAQVCALAGHQVALIDLDEQHAQAGVTAVAQRLQRLANKGVISELTREQSVARLQSSSYEGALPTADIAVEAVTEELEAKCRVFEQLDRLTPPEALLFSNTSSISITRLAAATRRPDQVAGVHFMNPVPLMRLVEIVRGLQTSETTLQAATDFAIGLEKTPVQSKDRPGFIVNRVLIPMLNEACFALQEGVAGAQDIDAAVNLGLNHPMGPLRLADLIGLDTVLAISEVLHRELGEDKYRPSALLRNLVAARQLGYKTGVGFYDYSGDVPLPNPSLH